MAVGLDFEGRTAVRLAALSGILALGLVACGEDPPGPAEDGLGAAAPQPSGPGGVSGGPQDLPAAGAGPVPNGPGPNSAPTGPGGDGPPQAFPMGMNAPSFPGDNTPGPMDMVDDGAAPTDSMMPMDMGDDMGADSTGPELGTVEDSGADCAIPELPPASQLSAYPAHHDPFTMLDGTRISQKSEWRCRRAELKAQLAAYESGPKPAVAPEEVRAELSGDSLSITVDNGSGRVSFSVRIAGASGASGPSPVLIAYGFNSLDRGVFSDNGVATITFNNDAMGAQSGGGSRGNGVFYDLYGRDHPASSMVAWAWGVSRIIDALEQTPEANLDPRRVAVTGCSRNGKGALLAGALDERIALTIPQESGAGGSASWRVSQAQSQAGENVQTLSSAAGEQPWFRADFGQNFGGGNVTKLPFDHHSVMGLVAPRALLVLDNRIDWLGIDSTFTAGSIAHAIWEAFDLGDHMGYWQTGGHGHCQFPAGQRDALAAYVEKFLIGDGTGDTNLLRAENANADLDRWMEWAPPSLQ